MGSWVVVTPGTLLLCCGCYGGAWIASQMHTGKRHPLVYDFGAVTTTYPGRRNIPGCKSGHSCIEFLSVLFRVLPLTPPGAVCPLPAEFCALTTSMSAKELYATRILGADTPWNHRTVRHTPLLGKIRRFPAAGALSAISPSHRCITHLSYHSLIVQLSATYPARYLLFSFNRTVRPIIFPLR